MKKRRPLQNSTIFGGAGDREVTFFLVWTFWTSANVVYASSAAARFLDAVITNAYLIPRVEIPREGEAEKVDTDVPTQAESQWIVGQSLLSALTIPGGN